MSITDLIPWKKSETEQEHPLVSFHRDINRLFDNFFSDFGSKWSWPLTGRIGDFAPRVDVSEDEKEVKISAELPGMDAKEVKIEATKDTLRISGEKKEEVEKKEASYHRVERSWGKFQREFALPSEVDPERVDARFKNGVLTVTLPKTESVRGRRIEIKAG